MALLGEGVHGQTTQRIGQFVVCVKEGHRVPVDGRYPEKELRARGVILHNRATATERVAEIQRREQDCPARTADGLMADTENARGYLSGRCRYRKERPLTSACHPPTRS